MRSSSRRLPVGVLCMVAALVTLGGAAVRSGASTPSLPNLAVTTLGPLETSSEHAGNYWIDRDEGISAALGGSRSLWIFGDTTVVRKVAGTVTRLSFITGSTAAEGRTPVLKAPTALDEVQVGSTAANPTTYPSHFMANPTALFEPGRATPCLNSSAGFPARWVTGAALIPSTTTVLITFYDVCLESNTSYPVEAWGFTEFNTSTNAFVVPPTEVFGPAPLGATLPLADRFEAPVFTAGGKLVLFSSQCTNQVGTTCIAGSVNAVSMVPTLANLENPASYVPMALHVDATSKPWAPLKTVSVNLYPGSGGSIPSFVLVEQTDDSGDLAIYRGSTATGPFHEVGTARLPGCDGPPPIDANGVESISHFCYAYVGHPEMSQGSTLVLTYFRPGYLTPGGHLMVVSVRLPVSAGM